MPELEGALSEVRELLERVAASAYNDGYDEGFKDGQGRP